MIKVAAVVLVLAACKPPTTPTEPISPLPPDPGTAVAAGSDGGAAPAAAKHVDWPKFPDLADVPVSHPTGDPIALPTPVVKAGDRERRTITSTFEQHYVSGTSTRYQLTKRDFDLEVTVLAVDTALPSGGAASPGQARPVAVAHPSRLEVVTHKANESVALADEPTTVPREDGALLDGTYTVSTGPSAELHDDTKVTRGPGLDVYGREQEELAGIFGADLRSNDPMTDFMRGRKLRLGEVVTVTDAEKKQLESGAVPSTVTLALVAVDPASVTYQLDIHITQTDDSQTEIRARGTVTFDRKTGVRLEQREQTHKHEVNKYGDDDTFNASTIRCKR